MNNRNILTAAVLAASLGVAHAGIFNPVGPQIREANSNWGLAVMQQSMSYAEVPPPFNYTTPPPNPLDSENGTLPGIRFFVKHQWAHFGFDAALNFLYGYTRYQGVIENISTGSFTPAATTTRDVIANMHFRFNYAFSPAPHLAIMPGIEVGGADWWRTVGYNTTIPSAERYGYNYAAARLAVNYAVDSVVLDVHGAYGHTYGAILSSTHGKFNLGTTPWEQIGARVTWNATQHLSLFVRANRTSFGFGHSSLTNAWVEPTSTTVNTTAEVGFMAHNLF